MTTPPLHLDLGDLPGLVPPLEAPGAVPAQEAAPYEIGVVYQKGGRYHLAVSERTLVTFKNGRVREVRPHTPYEPVRSMSVEELCRAWGIDARRLDELMARYVTPTTARTRPRGSSRRERAAAELAWMVLRTRRIAAAG